MVYSIEVHDFQKVLRHSIKKEVATKVLGRQHCAFEILKQEFGHDRNWLKFVDDTRQAINDERDRRGAPEKPILLQKKQYIQNQREQIDKEEFKDSLKQKNGKISLLGIAPATRE